jgi:hypothetical protein
MALPKQNLGRKKDSHVNSYQKHSEGSGFLKDKIKTEE